MRTSHKRIHELIREEKATLTDRELFDSKAYAAYLTDITEAATNRYRRHIKVKTCWDESPGSFVAYTDNKVTHINCGNRLTAEYPTRILKHLSLIGFNAHETGHSLYTDFEVLKVFMQAVDNNTVYPSIPADLDEDDTDKLNEYLEYLKTCDEKAKCIIKYVLHSLANIVEDVYIEDRLCDDFPGDFKTGIQLNNIKLTEDSISVEEQINRELPNAMILINTILQYARIGEFNNSTGYKGELLDVFYECIELIDEAVSKEDAKMRYDSANRIFIKMWHYVKDWIEKIQEDPSLTPQQVLDMLSGLDKEFGEGKGAEGPSLPAGSGTPCNGKFTPGSGGRLDELEKARDVIEEEASRIKLVKTDDIEESGIGKVEYDRDFEGSGYDKAAEDMERLLSAVAGEKADIRYNEELSDELQKESDMIRYGNAHRSVDIRIHRMTAVKESYIQSYNRIAPPLINISKRAQRLVSQKLKDESEGGRINGLYLGRRLNARSLVADDGKIFYNKKMPMDDKKLALGVLVDESGSMSCGDRITSARATAIVLYDFCMGLGIPVCIYGHTEHTNVDLYAYAEFDHPDNKDKFRLMDIAARSNNRDGAAVRFVSERLVKRSEPVKLLIIISDGQPAATGYYGTEAEADLRGIKHEYNNKGVTMFAAAIGNDKENIERIYQEGYLDITDLNALPVNLTRLVVKYLKR